MDPRQIILGIVLFLVFWAFQVGYFNVLGSAMWFVGALIFAFLPWLFEMGSKQKPPENMKQMWMFATLFVVVISFIGSFLIPYLGAVLPAGFEPSQMTPTILGLWLIAFGGAGLMHGIVQKQYVWSVIGIIWLFTAVHLATVPVVAANAYLHFALVVGLSFALAGIMTTKKSR